MRLISSACFHINARSFAFSLSASFNRFISAWNKVYGCWADIEPQMKQERPWLSIKGIIKDSKQNY